MRITGAYALVQTCGCLIKGKLKSRVGFVFLDGKQKLDKEMSVCVCGGGVDNSGFTCRRCGDGGLV